MTSILVGVAAAVTLILFSLLRRLNVAELMSQLRSGDFIRQFRFSDLINYVTVPVSPQKKSKPSIELSHELDLSILNSRAKLSQQQGDDGVYDAFEVEICGSIHAHHNVESATLSISIEDTTDQEPTTHPVQSVVKKWQVPDSSEFRYNAKLGKLPNQVTTISEWTSIAIFRVDWLVLPHKGKRELMFITSIFPAEGGEQLACARCYLEYQHREFGYLDLKENNQRSKTLAVALAFTVSAADGKMYDSEIELIKNWSRENIDLSETSSKERRKLEKALKETITFFREGNKLNSHDICREIVEIAPPADCESILNLCLHVAQANGSVTSEELNLLKDFANWLEIEADKFREMVQKVVPVDMYEVMDIETVLGVTSDMNKEKARRHLNKEYSKWSARVTNSDPEIQSQADQMLQLIADARSQYIG